MKYSTLTSLIEHTIEVISQSPVRHEPQQILLIIKKAAFEDLTERWLQVILGKRFESAGYGKKTK